MSLKIEVTKSPIKLNFWNTLFDNIKALEEGEAVKISGKPEELSILQRKLHNGKRKTKVITRTVNGSLYIVENKVGKKNGKR